MARLALLGNGAQDAFSRAFLALTEKVRPCLYLHGQGYRCSPGAFLGDASPLIVCDCAPDRISEIPFQITVLKDCFSGPVLGCEGPVLFNADRAGAVSLPTNGVIPVSYGLSEKNSVTVSSLGTDCITVTVQRELTGLRGQSIEPQDIVLKMQVEREELSPVIAAAIVLQLL